MLGTLGFIATMLLWHGLLNISKGSRGEWEWTDKVGRVPNS
jgi:hypothetical protein